MKGEGAYWMDVFPAKPWITGPASLLKAGNQHIYKANKLFYLCTLVEVSLNVHEQMESRVLWCHYASPVCVIIHPNIIKLTKYTYS